MTPKALSRETQTMYCICLRYGKDKPYLYNFTKTKKECLEDYKRIGLYKPEYTVIRVEVVIN